MNIFPLSLNLLSHIRCITVVYYCRTPFFWGTFRGNSHICGRINRILYLGASNLLLIVGSNFNQKFQCFGGGLVTKSCLTLATSWTVARQAPLSMEFPMVEILECVAISFSPGDLPDPGTEPAPPVR